MKQSTALVLFLAATLFTAGLSASSDLYNSDSASYKLLLDTSESCFSGTHTTIGGNTSTSATSGWACLNEEAPAVKLEDGKSYIIKDGEIGPR